VCALALVTSSAIAKPHKKPVALSPAHHTSSGIPTDEEMKNAVPLDQLNRLPSTSAQYKLLQKQIAKGRPAVETAKQKSETLAAQAATLRHKLVDTAARVQALEQDKADIDSRLVALTAQEKSLSQTFAHDRVRVAQLLAVLERLQSDMPPVLVLKADDALGAARGSMLLGASLPRVYGAAAALSKKLELLRKTRVELIVRRAESAKNALQLGNARNELDQLLAMKSREADEASATYGDLQSKLDSAADEATTLEMLLSKVSSLRNDIPTAGVTVISARPEAAQLAHGTLLRPVIGAVLPQSREDGAILPGMTFVSGANAQVIAPADSRVLFAGPYHKEGQVLILEAGGGYDLVLTGVDRMEVRPGDQLLAGEPLGTMPRIGGRLYFEVRQNGKGVSPAPWLSGELRKAKRT
jgi:murein hydrolase activator